MCKCTFEREDEYCDENNQHVDLGVYLDGIKINVGDKLYCLNNGWGEVEQTYDNKTFLVIFNEGDYYKEKKSVYTENGCEPGVARRRLYWNIPEIIPPKPPKKKVKKYKYVIEYSRKYRITDDYYTDEDVKKVSAEILMCKVIHCIKESEIEVEE